MKNAAAVELGRMGGKATAARRTEAERRAVAQKAAEARWQRVRESQKPKGVTA